MNVIIRNRPLLSHEITHSTSKLTHTSNTISIHESNENTSDTTKTFTFARVCGSETQQSDLFHDSVLPLLQKTFFEGYDATVFTYGQTGAGKSYTMVGDESRWNGVKYVEGSLNNADSTGNNTQQSSPRSAAAVNGTASAQPSPPVRSTSSASTRSKKSTSSSTLTRRPPKSLPSNYTPLPSDGIIPRAINWIFDQKHLDDASDSNYSIQISFLQIYEEKIYDLLKYDASGPPLRLRYAPKKEFYVENLFKAQVHTSQDAYQLLLDGLKNREVASHDMNLNSSRSHSIFTIEIHSAKDNFKSRCHLCDLPGSEKLSLLSANPSGKLVKESIGINKSLLALGMVIQALSQQGESSSSSKKRSQQQQYIPYRTSKLTSLLKSALGGSSYCTLIACVAPSDEYVLENLSTLYYASRATHIRNTPVRRINPKDKLIQSLRDKIEQLEMENSSLKNIVNQLGGSTMLGGLLDSGDSEDEEAAAEGQQEDDRVETPQLPVPQEDESTSSPTPPTTTDASDSNGITPSAVDSEALKKLKQDNKLLGEKLVDSVKLLKQYISINSQLNLNLQEVNVDNEAYLLDNDTLQQENLQLREKIEMLQSLVMSDIGSQYGEFERPYSAQFASYRKSQDSSRATMPNSDRFRKRSEEELLDSIRRRKEIMDEGRAFDIMERAASVYPASAGASTSTRRKSAVTSTTTATPPLSAQPRRSVSSSSGSRPARSKTPSSFPNARRKSSTVGLYSKKGYIPFSHKYQRQIFEETQQKEDE